MKDMIKMHRERLIELKSLIALNIFVIDNMYKTHNSMIDDLTNSVGCADIREFAEMDRGILRSRLNIMPDNERKSVLSKMENMIKIIYDILKLKDETEKLQEEAVIVDNVLKCLTHNG